MTYIVGITGGIGSGKSAATDHFATLGIEVVDADMAARKVVELGTPALTQIEAHFSPHICPDILLPSGELNRAALRQCIFADNSQKQWLENLLHPLIREYIQQQLQTIQSAYGILSSPLLLETQQDQLVHTTLVIDASEAQQQQRAQQRDNVSPEQIEKIMQAQLPRTERNARADDIISNNHSLDELHLAINRYHQQLLANLSASTD